MPGSRRCHNPACARRLPPSSDPLGRGRPRLWCDPECRRDGIALLKAARTATNPTCVDCGDPSMGGGLWCQPCFTGRFSGRAYKRRGAA